MSANDTVDEGFAAVDPTAGASPLERRLVDQIDASVEDPHIPVSLVELGMIYAVTETAGAVTVEMTYPCLGCPAYELLQEDIRACLLEVDGVDDVTVDVVWDPVWSKDELDAAVREKLRGAGTAV